MFASAKTPKVTGLKLTRLSVPLFPDTEAEIHKYGDELAHYLNGGKRRGKWLPYSDGSDRAAKMLQNWASKLPEPPESILRVIARYTREIGIQRGTVVAPIRRRKGGPTGRRIDLSMSLELDIPTTEAAVAYLLATVLSAGYGENLKQCKLDICAVWFFDVGEGRRTKEYCCEAHANSHRQRQWRERQKTKQRRYRK